MDHCYELDETVRTEEGMATWLERLVHIVERAWAKDGVSVRDQGWWQDCRADFFASNMLPPVPVWYVLACLEELRDVPEAAWALDGGRYWYFERLCRIPLRWSQRQRESALPAP